MQVSIVYDYLCPFCYKQHLVLKDCPELEVKPLPYLLKADVPMKGELIGEEDRVKLEKGERELEKDPVFTGRTLTGRRHYYNSYLAHQVGLGAYKKGAYLPFALAVYRAYFEEDKNIGDLGVLEDICRKLGLDLQELYGSVGADDMRKAIYEGYKLKTDRGLKTIPILYFEDRDKLVDHSTSLEELKEIVKEL